MSIKKISFGLPKNLEDKSYAYLIGVFLVLAAVLYLVFVPSIRKFGKISQQIRDKKSELSRVQQPSGEYRVLDKETKEMRSRKDLLVGKLLWESDISRFLSELTKLTSNSEVEFINIKPESALPAPEKDKEKFAKYRIVQIPISVRIKGSYEGLVNFLKKVEEGAKFIKIEYLNIESDSSSIYKHNINIRFSIIAKEEKTEEKA
jgi:Tfp pilus assembly protein PilO